MMKRVQMRTTIRTDVFLFHQLAVTETEVICYYGTPVLKKANVSHGANAYRILTDAWWNVMVDMARPSFRQTVQISRTLFLGRFLSSRNIQCT